MGDTIRLLGISELMVLLFCGGYLHSAYRMHVPPLLWRVGFAYAAVLVLFAFAAAMNLAADKPLTPGAYATTFGLVPITVVVVVVTFRALRDRDRLAP